MEKQAASAIRWSREAMFFILAFLGICILAWTALDNMPSTFLNVNLWLIAAIAPVLGFLFFRIRLDPLYGLMILGIPLGIIFSIIELVSMLQNASNPRMISLAVSTALSFAFAGGLLSSIGYFGCGKIEVTHTTKLKPQDFFLVAIFLCVLYVGVILKSSGLGAFIDIPSLKIFLAVSFIGIGIAKLKKSQIIVTLPNIFICVALIGAAFSTIGWILTSLTSDLEGIGPVMAIGLLTMLYGVFFYVLSFIFCLTSEQAAQGINFTTKNWHLVEGFTFLFFMTLGPPTLFEVLSYDDIEKEDIYVETSEIKEKGKAVMLFLQLGEKLAPKLVEQLNENELITFGASLGLGLKDRGLRLPDIGEGYIKSVFESAIGREKLKYLEDLVDKEGVIIDYDNFSPTNAAQILTNFLIELEQKGFLKLNISELSYDQKAALLRVTFYERPTEVGTLIRNMISGEQKDDLSAPNQNQ